MPASHAPRRARPASLSLCAHPFHPLDVSCSFSSGSSQVVRMAAMTAARACCCSVSVRGFALPRRRCQLAAVSRMLASSSSPCGLTNSYDRHSVFSQPVPRGKTVAF